MQPIRILEFQRSVTLRLKYFYRIGSWKRITSGCIEPPFSDFIRVTNLLLNYKRIGYHGFNIWEGNPLCKIPKSDGTFQTGCNGVDVIGPCGNMRFETKEASM